MDFKQQYFNTDVPYVCLLGSAPSSINLAPYANNDWHIVGCSPGVWGHTATQGLRVNTWVELHRVEVGQPWMSKEYFQFIQEFPGIVWMSETRQDVPGSTEVPIAHLITKYGPYFFTSSIAYMMAMAMEAGFQKIMLAGVDMAAESEYALQRPGLWYFGMLAKAKGVEVGVPPESDLFRPPPLYGLSEISHARIKMTIRRRELEHRAAEAVQRQTAAKDELLFLQGAIDDLKWVEGTWTGNVDGMSSRFVEPPVPGALKDELLG